MASFMGMAERGGDRPEYGRSMRELGGLGGDEMTKPMPVRNTGGVDPMPAQSMGAEPVQKMGGVTPMGVRNNPWMGGMPGRNGGFNAMGGNPNSGRPDMEMARPYGALGNPWNASGQIDSSKFTPEWAKPKPPSGPLSPVTTPPEQPVGTWKNVAGFSDFDPGITGTLAQGQDFITREAKARGVDTAGWNQDFMNGIANKIGYKGDGNLTGAQFNQARRALFGG